VIMSSAMTMEERRATSRAPKVCGVLSIIFASIVLLGGLMGTCGGFAGSSLTDIDLQFDDVRVGGEAIGDPELRARVVELVKDNIGGMYLSTGIISLVFAAMSAWLLAIGIGQVGYRAWARRHTMLWGWIALAVLLGVLVFSMVVIGPWYQTFLDEIQKYGNGFDSGMRVRFGSLGTVAGMGVGIFTIFFFAPYPIVLLSIFKGERAKRAMTA